MSPTLRDIATHAGVSVSAVSQALRGIGRISEATRARVLESARALDYRPDPLLSRALSRARQAGSEIYRETLGFIVEWKTETGPEHQQSIHAAAVEQAASMGYILETFVVSGKPAEQRRLSRILQARGIRGLIIVARLGEARPRLRLDWRHFAAIEIGRTLWHPRNLHHVESAAYLKILDALHLLKKVGYQRIGMAVEPTHNSHQNGVFYAAYLLNQNRLHKAKLPILGLDLPFDEDSFRQWMADYRPDVLIIHRVKLFSGWLKNLGLRVPEDISLFCINIQSGNWSGLRRDYAGMGRSAVEMVSLLLQKGELGLQGNPRCLQVDEMWQAGNTLTRPIDAFISREGFLLAEGQSPRAQHIDPVE